MAHKSGSVVVPGQEPLPVQAVDRPILCSPYEEPRDHWIYDKETGAASRAGARRPASYYYKTERTGSAQLTLTGSRRRSGTICRSSTPCERTFASGAKPGTRAQPTSRAI